MIQLAASETVDERIVQIATSKAAQKNMLFDEGGATAQASGEAGGETAAPRAGHALMGSILRETIFGQVDTDRVVRGGVATKEQGAAAPTEEAAAEAVAEEARALAAAGVTTEECEGMEVEAVEGEAATREAHESEPEDSEPED